MTEGQLLEALRAAQLTAAEDGQDGARTSAELREDLGWSKERVIVALKALKKAGQLDVVKVPREDLAGRVLRIPAYRLRGGDGQ